MQQLILVLHILVAVAIIALVLLQHGRGADVGASFGSGSSNTVFGSAGSVPFLMKLTAICAAIFFITSISLSYLAAHDQKKVNELNMPVLPAMPAQAQTAPVQNNTALPVSDAASFAPKATKK